MLCCVMLWCAALTTGTFGVLSHALWRSLGLWRLFPTKQAAQAAFEISYAFWQLSVRTGTP